MEQQQQRQTSLTEYDLILIFPTVKVLPMCPGPGPPSYKLLILTSDQLKVMIQLILTKGNIITTHKIDTLKIVYHRLGGRLCPNQKYKISHIFRHESDYNHQYLYVRQEAKFTFLLSSYTTAHWASTGGQTQFLLYRFNKTELL